VKPSLVETMPPEADTIRAADESRKIVRDTSPTVASSLPYILYF